MSETTPSTTSPSSPSSLPSRGLKLAFTACALLCLAPFISAPIALLGGMAFSILLTNPFESITKTLTTRLLALSIIGLGAGMNLEAIIATGTLGLLYTGASIIITLVIGLALGKFFKSTQNTSLLISIGTAICGGSAIAAAAPIIGARNQDTSIALAIIFSLNAIALLIFPPIGHALELSQQQFGIWSALAIHDTSSVVAATVQYGEDAAQIGTTLKLVRALWIIPITLALGLYTGLQKNKNESDSPTTKRKYPYFILGFIAMAALISWLPALALIGETIDNFARRTLILTLFLIGASLSIETFKTISIRPLLQGLCLWVIISALSLGAVMTITP